MTNAEKCEEILKKILEISNKENFSFERDWGNFTSTILIGNRHTHIGIPGGTWDDYVDSLYDCLIKGNGLSWA